MKKRKRNIVQADTPDGQYAGEALVEAVENQIQDNDPPETKMTLERLMSLGESRENAMRYIASVLSIEIFEALKNKSPYNEERYLRNLGNLGNLGISGSETPKNRLSAYIYMHYVVFLAISRKKVRFPDVEISLRSAFFKTFQHSGS